MIDPSYPSSGFIQFDKALDICHLMSHQWIGIYVLMSRRNEDWLPEALSLYFDVFCVNKVRYEISI